MNCCLNCPTKQDEDEAKDLDISDDEDWAHPASNQNNDAQKCEAEPVANHNQVLAKDKALNLPIQVLKQMY